MSFIIGIIWGIISALLIFVSTKYYIPRLSQHSNVKTEDNKGEIIRINKIVIIVLIVLFSGICGYFTSENATSVINITRIAIAFFVLLLVAQTDYTYMIIPNLCSEILLAAGIMSILAELIFHKDNVAAWTLNCILSALVTLIILMLMNKLTKGGIGLGDVKIFSSLSFLCGLRCVFATLMMALIICALVSIVLILFKKKTMKDALPLGPFIYFGYGISIILAII